MKLGPADRIFPGLWGLGWLQGYPVSGDITSLWGPREAFWTPTGWTRAWHDGIDVACAACTPIIYPGSRGVVVAEGPAING